MLSEPESSEPDSSAEVLELESPGVVAVAVSVVGPVVDEGAGLVVTGVPDGDEVGAVVLPLVPLLPSDASVSSLAASSAWQPRNMLSVSPRQSLRLTMGLSYRPHGLGALRTPPEVARWGPQGPDSAWPSLPTPRPRPSP